MSCPQDTASIKILAMRRIAWCCFAYGCLASLGALIWYVYALIGSATLPRSVWTAEIFLILHGMVMVVTLYKRPSRALWAPVLRLSPERIRSSRFVLLVGAANFLFCSSLVAYEGRHTSERVLSMVLTSFVLLNTTYIAIHWAFRPENIFSKRFLAFISNPVVYLFFRPKP
jgi:hypothetical protein